MMKFLRSLKPLGRWVVAGAVLALLLAGFLLVQSWRSTSTAKAEARLATNQTGAAMASGADAVETIGNQMAGEAAIDRITRENENAIRTAPGADAPVNPDLDLIARERLCRRAVYRQRPECLQHAPSD